jgi:phytanoyl-CoA hydroxylase
LELVDAFEPDRNPRSVFTTREQARHSDEYFLDSGDKVSFFFEEEAADADGNLRQAKELSINKIGHAMHDLDPEFAAFSRTPELAALAEQLGVGHHVLVQSMYIFKQPHIGGEVDCHTDHTFLWTDPASVVGFWFAVEDATVENGCLWALPGQHRLAPKKRFRRSDQGGTVMEVLDDLPYDLDGLVPLEAAAGTLIVLHGLLPHLSGANRSARSRHAYTLHTVDPGAAYPEDNWLLPPSNRTWTGFTGS